VAAVAHLDGPGVVGYANPHPHPVAVSARRAVPDCVGERLTRRKHEIEERLANQAAVQAELGYAPASWRHLVEFRAEAELVQP
jgi:hypothetical protein